MRILFLSVLSLLSVATMAQDADKHTISVSVKSDVQSAIENATVELFRAQDSSLVKAAITDNKGTALFENVSAGKYFIKASSVNHIPQQSASFETNSEKVFYVPEVTLPAKASGLKEVIVDGKKPFIQKLSDRIVVNVDNSIVNAGSSAMEVLERSPGVNVDQNDVISLRGKQGVIIMIDGKPTAMTGSDLANYLKGLPSTAIERIDIITNPSAKYDAAGNAGIIDLHMKKDQRLGANGTFTAGYGQGIYSKANSGATFNYRNKKVNIFGNYNYAYRVGLNHLFLDRQFFENGKYNGGDLKDNYSKSPFNSNTARVGADFFIDKKTIIGFVVNGNFNHYRRFNTNNSIVIDDQKTPINTFQSNATNNDHGNNVVGNINLKHKFDSTGKELSIDLDHGFYNSASLTVNATKYYKLDGSGLQPDYILNGDQKGKLNFTTAKADFVNPLKGGAKFETGFKISFVSSDNDAKFFDVSSGVPENDVNKTNHFVYHENNNAAYVNLSKEYKKFNVQFGLRGEQTNIRTDQKIGNVKFDSSYFQLFPSAFFNYKIKEQNTLGLSVSRRIDRPGYSSLNPFLFLIDVSTYATGNTGLLPQLTWSYELSYTVKSLNFSVSYSHTKDDQNITLARFSEVFPNIPSPGNVTVQIPINLSSSDYYGVSVSAPIRIAKWWNMINNGNLYYQEFHGKFSGTVLNNGKPAADIRTNNSFTLKNGWSAELNGSLNTGGQYGFMVLDPQWGVGAGVQKVFMQKKATLKFSITDIFWTNLPSAVITYNNYIEKWHAYRETRVGTLTFTYRFGKSSVQGARRRTTGSEEEIRRAGQ
jgi:iron complex outermembrane recepter protein